MSHRAREGAACEEMSHRLHSLITEDAAGCVLQTTARQALGGPALILASQPQEEIDPVGWGAHNLQFSLHELELVALWKRVP